MSVMVTRNVITIVSGPKRGRPAGGYPDFVHSVYFIPPGQYTLAPKSFTDTERPIMNTDQLIRGSLDPTNPPYG